MNHPMYNNKSTLNNYLGGWWPVGVRTWKGSAPRVGSQGFGSQLGCGYLAEGECLGLEGGGGVGDVEHEVDGVGFG